MKTITQQKTRSIGNGAALIGKTDAELKELAALDIIPQDIARAALLNLIAIRQDMQKLIEATFR